MKNVNGLSDVEYFSLFMVVNNPPCGMDKMNKEEVTRRGPLLKTLVAKSDIIKNRVDFSGADNTDLDLGDDEYIVLLDCIERAEFPTMMDWQNVMNARKKVLEA